MSRRPVIIAVWLLILALCIGNVFRTRFTADLSAFLPRSPTEEQALLVDLLRDGMVSRLLLVGVRGGTAAERAAVSNAMTSAMHVDPRFLSVTNGASGHSEADRAWVFGNRYLLSPAVDPEHFTDAGLYQAISHTLDLLASSAGLMVKPLLARDPTAETLAVLDSFTGGSQPARHDGVWASADGERALLIATTRAPGSDTDGQEAAIQAVRDAFGEARATHGSPEMQVLMTGPGVFAVDARETIRSEIKRLSLIGSALIITLLLLIYRSFAALALGLAPVVTGALAGILAVSLAFGEVHGITLGFGITLIGEAIDYAIYYFVQGAARAHDAFWRTIRLGVITSLCGFGALLLSGFPGLAQLGTYSMAGLLAAVLTTRFVLPALTPEGFRARDVAPLGRWLSRPVLALTRLRWPALALAVAAAALLWQQREHLWHHQLSALSPIPVEAQQLDALLRADLGAPDTRFLVVTTGASAEDALEQAEALAPTLTTLQTAGQIAAFDSPARLLPSLHTQQARRDALPPPEELRRRLEQATETLPLKAARLEGFISDVTTAREGPLLAPSSLEGTGIGLGLEAMLIRQGDHWRALLPLSSPRGSEGLKDLDAERIGQAVADASVPQTVFIDLARESQRMYATYLREAWTAALAGVAAIVVVLLATLRSLGRVLRLVLPLTAAVLVITALVVLSGERLTLLHLVGMLLVGAVGSNYALFFVTADPADGLPEPETLASLLIANLTTLCGFGVLALSSVPVMHAIGVIVGPGAILALGFSAMFASRPRHVAGRS
ncbi:MAG: MMPL family transporter [Rhodocyclaceae bacterium]|nr:MMPL family transporter [Rhodocyclaceae bacterium]